MTSKFRFIVTACGKYINYNIRIYHSMNEMKDTANHCIMCIMEVYTDIFTMDNCVDMIVSV